MPEKKDLYEQLLEQGYSKRSIHKVLHLLMLEQIKNGYKPKSPVTVGLKRLWVNLLPFFRKIKPTSNVSGKALSLLKSQFAKKPKNPV